MQTRDIVDFVRLHYFPSVQLESCYSMLYIRMVYTTFMLDEFAIREDTTYYDNGQSSTHPLAMLFLRLFIYKWNLSLLSYKQM